jgi:hypothetical protein
MVHDELPSDVWWHDTDANISRIHDIMFFERFLNSNRSAEEDLKNVISLSEDIKSQYREALLIDEHRVQSGIISKGELEDTNEWFYEGISQVGGIVANFRYVITMTHLGSDENEIEILVVKIKIMLSELREHTRSRYLFDREVEHR